MLSENLIQIRKEKNLDIDVLATKSRISRKNIENLESGKNKNPRLKTLIQLAEALDVAILDLIQ